MWILLAVALSACAYYGSVGFGVFWPAVWIAPIPVLAVAFRSSWRTAACAAFAAYFIGNLNLFPFLARVMPAALVTAVLAASALVCPLAVLAARLAVRRLPPAAAACAFPAAWTACEFLVARLSPHGTFMNLAYSQTGCLPLLQIASITGLWGVTFVVTLVPSAIAVAWHRRAVWALAPAAVVGVVLGYGVARLQNAPTQPMVRVGLAATDGGIETAFRTDDPAKALAVAQDYAHRVARLAAEGAQVVVLPEKFVGLTPADSNAIEQVFSEAARAAHVTVIAGFNRFTPQPPRNVAAVFAPDGRLVLEYEKRHMLPGPETGYEIGTTVGLFSGPAAQWGVAICKDMDFPAWSRVYGRRGVRILAVPAWDFVADGRLHSRMAVMRAVEDGFSMARAAQQGLLTFSDAYGRILGEAASYTAPEALLVRSVPAGPGATVYNRLGDWFGWSCVLGLTGIIYWALGSKGH